MSIILGLLFTAIVGFIFFYITLPALTMYSFGFCLFLLVLVGIFVVIISVVSDKSKVLIITPILFFILMIALFLSSSFFHADRYSNMINPIEKSFEKDFRLDKTDNIPLLDKDSAIAVGDKKLGEIPSLVSQYQVDELYTQININGKPYRISQLEYSGFFKWWSNHFEGINHYVKIDMVTGKTELVKLGKPIKYSYSERFGRNIKRHLRFSYPTKIFKDIHLEIDDNGEAYYIAPYIKPIVLFGRYDVNGLIVVNANTGECKEYSVENAPKWIDRIYPSNMIISQLDDNGSLKNGWLNSIFTKKGVSFTTEGYNYLAINDDIYLYTGKTSAGSDSSSLGFYLVNLRTKETTFYKTPVATEMAAVRSAEGSVQEKEYTGTFPLLLKINNKPYYILSLKDNAGLVKAYSLVDAQDYQKVYTESNLKTLFEVFSQKESVDINSGIDMDLKSIKGHIEDLKDIVVNGNTVYYVKVNGKIHKIKNNISDDMAFAKNGQVIEIKFKNGKTESIRIN